MGNAIASGPLLSIATETFRRKVLEGDRGDML